MRNEELVEEQRKMYADEPLGRDMASAYSLVEILDGVVMLYSIAAHRQLAKVRRSNQQTLVTLFLRLELKCLTGKFWNLR